MIQQIKRASRDRIYELDLLRGFFILVIIIDHFQRWPSVFTYLTGEGRLWTSAAEGFFIISGLLIGYLRGYKQREVPFKNIAKLLLKRGVLLYIWAILITFIVVAVSVIFEPNDPLVPIGPNADQVASIGVYLKEVFTQMYSSDWIFFLRLYAIMLFVSPLFIWLLRKGLWWIATLISVVLYGMSFLFFEPEAALQWQVYFFGAGLIGFKLDTIREWFTRHPVKRKILSSGAIVVTLLTMMLSYFWVFGWGYVESSSPLISRETYVSTREWLDPLFSNNPVMPARIILSFIWVSGLFALFHYGRGLIMKTFGWLLMLFGQRSLSAYCLQALFFLPVQYYVFRTESPLINASMTIIVILVFWGILKIPLVQKILPK